MNTIKNHENVNILTLSPSVSVRKDLLAFCFLNFSMGLSILNYSVVNLEAY
jgi:hypothetical protein